MQLGNSDRGIRIFMSMANLRPDKAPTTDFKSFTAQFENPMPNVNEYRRKYNKPPTGKLLVHFLDNPSFEVDFYIKETVQDLKNRIQQISKLEIFNYNIVCKNGTMKDDHTLDEYKLKANTRIVIVEKGAVSAQRKLTRERWLELSKCRSCGVSRTDLNFLNNLGPYRQTRLAIKVKPKEKGKLGDVQTFFNELTLDQL